MSALNILEAPPPGLFDTSASDLEKLLGGPTLIKLEGAAPEVLFISVLLHGNETSGWHAVCEVLRDRLKRNVWLFIGNVAAAAEGVRTLAGQHDYNRIWNGDDGETVDMVTVLLAELRTVPLFAAIDLHNNTGRNPHYSVLTKVEPHNLGLGYLFSDQAVYVEEPDTVLTRALHNLCPAVTVEVGPVNDRQSDMRAAKFVADCLDLEVVPETPREAIKLHRSLGRVHIPDGVVFDFVDDVPQGMEASEDLILTSGMEAVNFHPLPAGTEFAAVRAPLASVLTVLDAEHNDVTHQYFEETHGIVTLRQPVIPAMFTTDHAVVQQDCLCYFMERMD